LFRALTAVVYFIRVTGLAKRKTRFGCFESVSRVA